MSPIMVEMAIISLRLVTVMTADQQEVRWLPEEVKEITLSTIVIQARGKCRLSRH